MSREPTGVPLDRRAGLIVELAPSGFGFPTGYLQLIADGELPDVSPLFWLLRLDDGVQAWTRILGQQYPGREYVPIAKHRSTDDVYCFDGTDLTGNPPVVLVHSFTEAGWEYRGEWVDFDSWYEGLIPFHEEWERAGLDFYEPPFDDDPADSPS